MTVLFYIIQIKINRERERDEKHAINSDLNLGDLEKSDKTRQIDSVRRKSTYAHSHTEQNSRMNKFIGIKTELRIISEFPVY